MVSRYLSWGSIGLASQTAAITHLREYSQSVGWDLALGLRPALRLVGENTCVRVVATLVCWTGYTTEQWNVCIHESRLVRRPVPPGLVSGNQLVDTARTACSSPAGRSVRGHEARVRLADNRGLPMGAGLRVF